MSKKIIGIDLGGTSVKFAILTLEGEIQEKWSIKTNVLDEGSHIVDDMVESILHRLDLLQLTAENFIGIGMGSPGVVDREKGTVIGAYNLNWKTLQPVKDKIEKATGIPFYIRHALRRPRALHHTRTLRPRRKGMSPSRNPTPALLAKAGPWPMVPVASRLPLTGRPPTPSRARPRKALP